LSQLCPKDAGAARPRGLRTDVTRRHDGTLRAAETGLTEEYLVRTGGTRASLAPVPGRHARDPERAGPVAHIGDAYDNDALEAEPISDLPTLH